MTTKQLLMCYLIAVVIFAVGLLALKAVTG